jgi:DNA modification methylase
MTVDIRIGDCRDLLAAMPDKSVDCCVTSPPYFGLRDYGHEGQIGLEQTPDDYVAEMVAVFRSVKRVLRDDGTLWLNLGDSYAGSWGNQGRKEDRGTQRPVNGPIMQNLKPYPDKKTNTGKIPEGSGLKPKDLIGIPWRVAFALQTDGWYLRQDIIWHKPNPMPESVKDRCTKAHEYIFMLSKSARYYYDVDAIKEPAIHEGRIVKATGSESKNLGKGEYGRTSSGFTSHDTLVTNRKRRSVWTVSTKPFKGAHFATFPPDLIEPCVLAGCPADGTVLDPFGGAGTTGVVASRRQRNAILLELNPEYAAMARERIDAPVTIRKAKKPANDNHQRDLFAA